MFKKFGFTIGGLQQKIFNLVLVFMIGLVAVFAAVSIYQSKNLTHIVEGAREEQQKSITEISELTMKSIIDGAMKDETAMKAYIADDVFSEVQNNVKVLQEFSSQLFRHSDSLEKATVAPPDRNKDGTPTVMILSKEGTDLSRSAYYNTAANMSDILLAMYENSDKISSCYIATPDGLLIVANDRPAVYTDESGRPVWFDARERPWYKDAVEQGCVCYSNIILDKYTDIPMLVCSAPVYKDGRLVAVVGADIFLTSIAEYVESSADEHGFDCIVNDEGQVIFSPMAEGMFRAHIDNTDLRSAGNDALASFIDAALAGTTEATQITADGKDYYMVGSPISTVGWTLVSAVEVSATRIPTEMMLSEYEKINESASGKFYSGVTQSERTTLVMTALLLLLGSGCALMLANNIVKPIEHMTKRINELRETGGTFAMEEVYRTDDEIQVLAESFEMLSERTKQYILEITEITKEKERIGTELELANKIQADMLPNIFPPFPDRPDFDLYASMTPAKEVGGDFYDFFLIDDDHLCLVMADVSGKGVPAALFMMMSKILVSNFVNMGSSPAKALEQTNAVICKNNDEEMFVTVWLGIMEISTGKVTAANAGHEYPVIKTADGSFALFKDKHGFVVGGMDGMKYKEYEFTVEKGGALFLYTDGVPEATSADNELFGTDRMLEALNSEKDAEPKELLENVKKAVDGFVGDAPQFDDLTMLAFVRRKI